MSEKLEKNNETTSANLENKETEENRQKSPNKPVTNSDSIFSLKRWNLVAMWSWDVECEVCAICRTPLMGMFNGYLIF